MSEKLDLQDLDAYWPLTPPSSPCNLDLNITTHDFGTTLEDVPMQPYKTHDSIVIKDCMWGAKEVSTSFKDREHSYTRLYLGELPSTKAVFDSIDLSSKFLSSVDPTEVFPHVSCIDERAQLMDLNSCESGKIYFLFTVFLATFFVIVSEQNLSKSDLKVSQ